MKWLDKLLGRKPKPSVYAGPVTDLHILADLSAPGAVEAVTKAMHDEDAALIDCARRWDEVLRERSEA